MGKKITVQLRLLLRQLEDVLTTLDDTQYTAPIGLLSEASLGQHIRHPTSPAPAVDHPSLVVV